MVCGAKLCDEHECHLVNSSGPHSKKGREQLKQWRKHEEARDD
jgi:hypothetical protein